MFVFYCGRVDDVKLLTRPILCLCYRCNIVIKCVFIYTEESTTAVFYSSLPTHDMAYPQNRCNVAVKAAKCKTTETSK